MEERRKAQYWPLILRHLFIKEAGAGEIMEYDNPTESGFKSEQGLFCKIPPEYLLITIIYKFSVKVKEKVYLALSIINLNVLFVL